MAFTLLNGKFHADKTDGTPAVGWRLYSYASGTTTPQATYQDSGRATTNTNPIVLDARGEAQVWLNATSAYTVVLKTDADVQVWSIDGIIDPAVTATTLDAALRSDLSNQSTASKGAGMVGYNRATAYASGTVGDKLNQVMTPLDYGAKGDGVTDDAAALALAFASGKAIDLRGYTYVSTAGLVITGSVLASGATIKYTSNITTGVDIRPGASIVGRLTLDLTTVTVTNGILCDGQYQSTHGNAQKTDGVIFVKGKDHSSSINGVSWNCLVAGAANKAWLHYMDFGLVVVENFSVGLNCNASQASLTLSYCNANRIKLTAVGCKKGILTAAPSGEVADNTVQFISQYGWVSGSGPTSAIELTGISRYNKIDAFIYDWDHSATPAPVMKLAALATDNTIRSSLASWEFQDLGLRNKHESTTTPARSNLWLSPDGRGFLGDQDNVLAHWSPSIGTLTGTASTTGTAVCNLASGTVTDVTKENSAYVGIAYASGSGRASYTFEFRSTTVLINGLSMVGVYFENTYGPDEVAIQIDAGSGYVTRADITDISGNEVFCRLDSVSGSDIYNSVVGVKVILSAADTRQVRVRKIFANGTAPCAFISRGGDRVNGDLRWNSGNGPVVIDTVTGNECRLKISNGVLAIDVNPTKTMTHF